MMAEIHVVLQKNVAYMIYRQLTKMRHINDVITNKYACFSDKNNNLHQWLDGSNRQKDGIYYLPYPLNYAYIYLSI